MYGQNLVAKKRSVGDGLKVHSMFYTIQGEGPEAGTPALFVRFAGCNLKCHFCDTDFAEGSVHTPDDLAKLVANMLPSHRQHRIVLTGGEPMLQPLSPFIRKLIDVHGQRNMIDIETAGSVWPEGLEQFSLSEVKIVCSPKTPGVHPLVQKAAQAWKYIIRAGEVDSIDGLPNKATQVGLPIVQQLLFRPPATRLSPSSIYVQPCDENDVILNQQNAAEAANSAMKFGYKLSIQLHKIVGLP